MINKIQRIIKAPAIVEGNPGRGYSFRVAFSNTEKTWEEEINLVGLLARSLTDNQVEFKEYDTSLLILEDMILQPQILSFNPRDDSSVSTSSTIPINSAKELSSGLFEYQHSVGNNLEDSLIKGFNAWIKSDLKTLIESIQGTVECTQMQMELPGKKAARQITFGPVTRYIKTQSNEEHSFCPCCFFTNNFEVFRPIINSNDVFGIRFFASRSENGEIEADCRINGMDFEAGKNALIEYGKTWQGEGFDFRKQYVIVRNKVG